jgi:hypothetical protein
MNDNEFVSLLKNEVKAGGSWKTLCQRYREKVDTRATEKSLLSAVMNRASTIRKAVAEAAAKAESTLTPEELDAIVPKFPRARRSGSTLATTANTLLESFLAAKE